MVDGWIRASGDFKASEKYVDILEATHVESGRGEFEELKHDGLSIGWVCGSDFEVRVRGTRLVFMFKLDRAVDISCKFLDKPD